MMIESVGYGHETNGNRLSKTRVYYNLKRRLTITHQVG